MLPAALVASARSVLVRQKKAALRREKVLVLHLTGLTNLRIAQQLGVSERTIRIDMDNLSEKRAEIEAIIEDEAVNAEDAWLTLTKMHDADLADIVDNPGDPIEQLRFKPLEKWPAIWRQGLAGKVKMTPVSVSERSHDGVQAGESRSWDRVGVAYKIEIERESLLKILELTLKLKSVDGLAKQLDSKDIADGVQEGINRAIAEGRKRAAQRTAIPERTDPNSDPTE